MRPHGRHFALCASSIEADTVTGNPDSVQFLNDWMVPSYRVAKGSHFQPLSMSASYRVLRPTVNIRSVSVSREMELFYCLKDIHFYLLATYNYSRSVTPAESMTTIA